MDNQMSKNSNSEYSSNDPSVVPEAPLSQATDTATTVGREIRRSSPKHERKRSSMDLNGSNKAVMNCSGLGWERTAFNFDGWTCTSLKRLGHGLTLGVIVES